MAKVSDGIKGPPLYVEAVRLIQAQFRTLTRRGRDSARLIGERP